MKRETKTVKVRVGMADYASWVAEAKKANLTVSEWLRRRVSLRPTTARKRKYSEVLAEAEAKERALSAPGLPSDPDEDDDWDPKTDPELVGQERKWQARLEAERQASARNNRRWKANGLSYAAGGVERWFASMTPEQHAEWDDLRDDMLRCERNQ
jgi:hypothetical protein